MCATCGCSEHSESRLTDLQSGVTVALTSGHEHEPAPHHHDHAHDHGQHHHDHEHSPGEGRGTRTLIALEHEVLARNDRLATWVRGWLAGRGIVALNLVS